MTLVCLCKFCLNGSLQWLSDYLLGVDIISLLVVK